MLWIPSGMQGRTELEIGASAQVSWNADMITEAITAMWKLLMNGAPRLVPSVEGDVEARIPADR